MDSQGPRGRPVEGAPLALGPPAVALPVVIGTAEGRRGGAWGWTVAGGVGSGPGRRVGTGRCRGTRREQSKRLGLVGRRWTPEAVGVAFAGMGRRFGPRGKPVDAEM